MKIYLNNHYNYVNIMQTEKTEFKICNCKKCINIENKYGKRLKPINGLWKEESDNLFKKYYSVVEFGLLDFQDDKLDCMYIQLYKNNQIYRTHPIFDFFFGITEQTNAISRLEKECEKNKVDLFKQYIEKYYTQKINYTDLFQRVIKIFPLHEIYQKYF